MENVSKQIIRVFEAGRNYETTYTKKYEKRIPWVRPNPEEIKSFIPGTVEKIMVKIGEQVTAGQEIMIYVAMKMHNIIRAPFAGTVTAILVETGSKLPRGTIMMVIRQDETTASTKTKKKSVRKRIVSQGRKIIAGKRKKKTENKR
ncbi:MAG: acetyl-CoA carboxylase biotin carboxyl carrier protein subunit [Bacteroidales bacterium]|nr:acetyl-CoA carboxylase biotin carboxyl carrier protein subunit [Bacteroidales bacterium]MCL2133556.1 acetyl-CoA carboxylase biotin carboxyl carrier protein subunit [Bacteroidales bacterium]